MGILGNIFNDVVDIVSAPVKILTTIVDGQIDTDLTDSVEDLTDVIKIDKE